MGSLLPGQMGGGCTVISILPGIYLTTTQPEGKSYSHHYRSGSSLALETTASTSANRSSKKDDRPVGASLRVVLPGAKGRRLLATNPQYEAIERLYQAPAVSHGNFGGNCNVDDVHRPQGSVLAYPNCCKPSAVSRPLVHRGDVCVHVPSLPRPPVSLRE